MALLNWITDKFRPPAADKPQTPSRTEVLSSSEDLADRGPSPSSSSVPVQNKSIDATKHTTISFAPPASDPQPLSATTDSITNRRGIKRAPIISLALAGQSSRSSFPARNSDLRPLTPYPPPPATALVHGSPALHDEFDEYKEEMKSQLQEANTRTQDAYRQLLEQEQKHEREKLNWHKQSRSVKKPSLPRPSRSVQQQTSPCERRESTFRVDTPGDESLGANQAGGSLPSSRVNLPFKLRKLSTELVLARAEACMILREWDDMERRSKEALGMAAVLQYKPLIARCQFFLGIAFHSQNKWGLATDAFEFAKPCVGVYITARELDAWRQEVDSVMGAPPDFSIESTLSPSGEYVSNIGWENGRDFSFGGSTPESTINPIPSPEESPTPYERSPRPRKSRVLPRTPSTTSAPTHGPRRSSSSDWSNSATFPRNFPIPSGSDGSIRSPRPRWQSESPMGLQGSEETAVAYLGRATPPLPMTRGPRLSSDISFPVHPRRSRLYTPGDDHIDPPNPLRQGPRLRLIIPVKTFPGPGPISPIGLRPSRIYMPDKPEIGLYPLKPFRQGKRLKLIIPPYEPQSPPLEVISSPRSQTLVGWHSIPTHSPVLPPPTPPPFSNSSSDEYSPRQPRKPPSPHRTQGLRVANQDSLTPDAPSKPNKSQASSSDSSREKAPWHNWPTRQSPPAPRRAQATNNTGSRSEGSLDELTRYIQELSQPIHTKPLRVMNRTSPSESSTNKSSPLPTRSQGRTVANRTFTSESSTDKSPPLPNRPQGLRVANRTSESGSSAGTSESSSNNSSPLPNRPQGLRVVNPTSTSDGSSEDQSWLPNRSLGIQVVDRPFSTPESGPSDPLYLPDRTRNLQVANRTPTPESSLDRPPPLPNRPGLRVINCSTSTLESSLDNPSLIHTQDYASPGQGFFTPEQRPMPTGEALWFPDTGSGRPRYLESPDRFPDGVFTGNWRESMNQQHDDTETEAAIEIGAFVPRGGSTRPDIRQMVWRPPSRDHIQPQRRDMEELSSSSDETENMAFVRLLGLGISMPNETLGRGIRVSERIRNRTSEDDQLWEDYVEERGVEAHVAHIGIERIRRSRSGDLGSSGNDWRNDHANASTGALSSDDSLLFDARNRHEGYTREEEQYRNEEARPENPSEGIDRLGRDRSRGTSENRSRRSRGTRSWSGNQRRAGGVWQIGEGDLDLTL